MERPSNLRAIEQKRCPGAPFVAASGLMVQTLQTTTRLELENFYLITPQSNFVSMSNGLFWLAAVFVACLFGSATVGAAEIRMDPSGAAATGVVLEGKIAAGDFDNFQSFILNDENAKEIYLASPGGDLAEAMKIGLLVRNLKLSTVVPSKALTNQNHDLAASRHDLKNAIADYMCASACFFVFVAGVHRSSDDQGPPILGIHRPSLVENNLSRLNLDQATTANNRVRTTIESYLKLMDVPPKYAENMYSVPKGRIRWIRNDEFQADFSGSISESKH